MTLTLLSLPLEIRDLIYDLVLLSPTGYVELGCSCRCPTYSGLSALSFRSQSHYEPGDSRACTRLSISLLRTCHQIHSEATSLFWTRNTFLLSNINRSFQILKDLGQIPSRKITKIELRISPHAAYGTIKKILKALKSRTRKGALRFVRICFKDFNEMLDLRAIEAVMSIQGQLGCYDDFLETMRTDSEGWVGEKEMKVDIRESMKKLLGRRGEVELTVRELHFAWGGRMVVNGRVVWKDYGKVAEIFEDSGEVISGR